MHKYQSIKRRVFEIISKAENGDIASKIFDWSIMALIALSIISIILESFASIYNKWHTTFQVFEIITVVVFTIEYILRVWTADLLYPEAKHPRLKYIFSFMAIIRASGLYRRLLMSWAFTEAPSGDGNKCENSGVNGIGSTGIGSGNSSAKRPREGPRKRHIGMLKKINGKRYWKKRAIK